MLRRSCLVLLATLLTSCGGIFDENGPQCCCYDPSYGSTMPPRVTHSDFCGGKAICTTDPAQAKQLGCGNLSSNNGSRLNFFASVDEPPRMSRAALRVLAPDPVAPSTPQTVSTQDSFDSCLNHCPAGKVTADCLTTHLTSSDAAYLKHLKDKVVSPAASTIDPKELLSMFNVADDPCHRGATVVNGVSVSNSGDDCAINASTQNNKIRININIPAKLQATWGSRNANDIRLNFEGNPRPTVAFIDSKSGAKHALDSEFGGGIKWLEADGKRLMVRTDAPGCVGVDF